MDILGRLAAERRGSAHARRKLERLEGARVAEMARDREQQARGGNPIDFARPPMLAVRRVDLLHDAQLHVMLLAGEAQAARIPAVGVEDDVVVDLQVPASRILGGDRRQRPRSERQRHETPHAGSVHR